MKKIKLPLTIGVTLLLSLILVNVVYAQQPPPPGGPGGGGPGGGGPGGGGPGGGGPGGGGPGGPGPSGPGDPGAPGGGYGNPYPMEPPANNNNVGYYSDEIDIDVLLLEDDNIDDDLYDFLVHVWADKMDMDVDKLYKRLGEGETVTKIAEMKGYEGFEFYRLVKSVRSEAIEYLR